MLSRLMERLGEGASENLLSSLIESARLYAVDYCNLERYVDKLDGVIFSMVLEDYNRMGAEGIVATSHSGQSESYAQDYSPIVYKSLRKNRKIRTVGKNVQQE